MKGANAPHLVTARALPLRGFAKLPKDKSKDVVKNDALVQIRGTPTVAEEVKRAALEANMTISTL